jgi:hypothetical protein
MNPFQIIALSLLIPTAVWSLQAAIRHRRRRHFLLTPVLGIGIVFVIRPDIATRVANLLGIGRGADLVTYLTALAVLGCYFLILSLDRSIRLQITELTRAITLMQLPHAPHEQTDLASKIQQPQSPQTPM